jgi:putative DNA methylase
MTTPRKKLIEVALPLPEINDASAYDKMPGIGPHPKGIHHWWARLPLPTARAVLFASVVTDPSDDPAWKDKGEQEQDAERERLFGIIRRMMGKRLHEHPEVYAEARAEMLKHCDGKLPPVLDPFSGGGSIPLEAARLGFEAHAADLNPVAVLLNKCNLELAPRWANHPPVNPEDRKRIGGGEGWTGTRGLAADVRYYGRLIRQRAQAKIGHLYPKVRLPKEHGGGEANVIAWLWARTVASQDPAAKGAHVPLVSTYWLSTKGDSQAWLEPVVDRAAGTYRFEVRTGTPKDKAAVKAGTKLGRGAKFKCQLSGQPLDDSHIKAEGVAGRLGYRLLAVVAEVKRGRIYLPADAVHEQAGNVPTPADVPHEEMAPDPRNIWCVGYGLKRFDQLFTPRQLTTLTFLSDAVRAIRAEIVADFQALEAAAPKTPNAWKADAEEYAKTVCTFLALAVDRTADFNNSLCAWNSSNQKVMHLFGRQAIPMVWDFAEANTLGDSVGAWSTCADYVADCVEVLGAGSATKGHVTQHDAAQAAGNVPLMVSTDPPYYDNIGYAALSDFFYVWLRRTIGDLYRPLCDTVLVPKMPELTASPERFEGDKEKAKEHFESGFRKTFTHLRERLDPRFPLTVYYAFKQDDEESGADAGENGNGSVDLTTGWETLLDALISSGFTITATCPVRASQAWRMVSVGTNALASYIVLACRPRTEDKRTGRAAFIAELKRELPSALHHLQQGNVAPVDFAQAAIGPGMAVFSKYSAVLESNGKPMSVRTALALINGIKDELLGEAVEELDKDTRWATTWFAETGFDWGEAGKANLLANAQATAVNALVAAGIVEVKANQVRLYRPDELPVDWDPATDKRLTVWEMTHHLIRVYVHEKKGDAATAELMRKLGSKAEVARDLAYKLFTVCESKKRSQEAQAYNELVMGWPVLTQIARELAVAKPKAPEQGELL